MHIQTLVCLISTLPITNKVFIMNVLDNNETVTYKAGDLIKYPFPMINKHYVSDEDCCMIYTYMPGEKIHDKATDTIVVTYKNGKCHSINGQPAIVVYKKLGSIRSFTWCHEGKIHREQGLPAHITSCTKLEYIDDKFINSISKNNTNPMVTFDDQYND